MRARFRVNQGLLLLLAGALLLAAPRVSAKPGGSPPAQVPASPQGLVATPGDAWISLTWSASSGAANYHLKRSTTKGGPYEDIAAPVSTRHTDAGLANGTTYFYVVAAISSAGESANSSEVSAKPVDSARTGVPSVPQGLKATAGNGWVSLTWSPSSGAASYHLKRATASGGPYQDIASPTSTGHTDAGLANGSTYFYVVAAIGSSGESANSASVSAKPAGQTSSANSAVPDGTTAPSPTSSANLPSTFFSQTWNSLSAHDYPSVPFGGMRLWNTGTTWAEIETSRDSYKWSELDEWLAVGAREDKDVLYTFGRTPQWASMRPTESCSHGNIGCAAPPVDVESGDARWKEFVTAVVKHSLASSNGHIKYYEVWDEPNDVVSYWSGTYAQLATMAKDAYSIIHSLDPNARVVGPGPTGSNTVQWLASYYEAGARNAQDIVCLHTYTTAKTDPAAIAARIDSLRSMMTSNGIGNDPIWSTEGGFGELPLSSSQKAATVAQLYIFLWSKDVARFYWYAWDSINNWGTMWTPSGGVNASGATYGLLYHWLVGSTHPTDPCSEASDGTWTCTLTLSSDYPAEIIWNATSKSVTVSSAFATYQTLTNSTVHSIAENKVTIGSEPILLIKSQAVINQ
jgi:hypothetical protein